MAGGQPEGALGAGAGWVGVGYWNKAAGSADRFFIAPDQVPAAKAHFLRVIDQCMTLRNKAQGLAFIDAPGTEQVSREAVRLLGERAVGGGGCLIDAVDSLMEQAQSIVEQLEASTQTYSGTDAAQFRA